MTSIMDRREEIEAVAKALASKGDEVREVMDVYFHQRGTVSFINSSEWHLTVVGFTITNGQKRPRRSLGHVFRLTVPGGIDGNHFFIRCSIRLCEPVVGSPTNFTNWDLDSKRWPPDLMIEFEWDPVTPKAINMVQKYQDVIGNRHVFSRHALEEMPNLIPIVEDKLRTVFGLIFMEMMEEAAG